MHGINLGTLHVHIHKEVLPAELGGTLPPYNNLLWAKQLIGDESFSFGDKQIYWPGHCAKYVHIVKFVFLDVLFLVRL